MKEQTKWGIYIHIPFCLQKCHYCDFVSYASSEETWDFYTETLRNEIRYRSRLLRQKKADSIFFGGGTPSLLGPKRLGIILDELRQWFDLDGDTEITFEVNPETVEEQDWAAFKKKGFTRASIGVQSLQNQELVSCGRVHNEMQARKAVKDAWKAGFAHINVDLMYGLPLQTLTSLQKTVHEASGWPIDHLSIYGLQIEEGTLFDSLAGEGKLSLPSQEEEEAMYDWLQNYLPKQGFARYEISNFARSQGECRHNLKYWNYEPYLGFGVAACGFDGKGRLNNPDNLEEYTQWVNHLAKAKEKLLYSEMLSEKELMAEFCFMNFRKKDGISLEAFKRRFGRTFEHVYASAVQQGAAKGWIQKEGERYVVTAEGFRFNNLLGQLFL